jgi:hypothetical protein
MKNVLPMVIIRIQIYYVVQPEFNESKDEDKVYLEELPIEVEE